MPPGYLTPHGADAIAQMGRWMRAHFATQGLLPASGCPAPAAVYLYADTDERNIASTRSTFGAFAQGCDPLPVHVYVPPAGGARDPLFNYTRRAFPDVPPANGERALADMDALLHHDPAAALGVHDNPELLTLAHILAPEAAHPPQKSFLNEPVSVTANPASEGGVSVRGPLTSSGTLAEDILLEYVDGKPMSDVGWGRASAADVLHISALNARSFALHVGTPTASRRMGANLAAQILATLQQAAQVEMVSRPAAGPVTGTGTADHVQPLAPACAKLVYLSGHDTNLHELAGLLNLRWSPPGIAPGDTPPDSQIVFELWQRAGGQPLELRVRFRAQTLAQLRSAEPLTGRQQPIDVPLTPPGCTASAACDFNTFATQLTSLIDPAFVISAPQPIAVAP